MIMNQKFILGISVVAMLCFAPLTGFAKDRTSAAAADQSAAGQTITVKGVVYDDQGAPLPGAGVVIKGTTKGTTTDLDGNYELRVGANQTLVVSLIGFKDQEVAVNGRGQINVALQSEATSLDDVVVVGYGTVKKANLTGAVDVVEAKTFENRVVAGVDQMMLGAVPSVSMATIDGAPYRNVNNLSGYQIRGIWNTLATSSAAGDYFGSLVLIDGVEGDPASLNPNDIESISVLKDAAASAIYGSRGAYGVMLITTKNPVEQDKVSVTYTGNFNVMTPTAMPDLLTDGVLWSDIKMEAHYGYQERYSNVSNIWPASTSLKVINDGIHDANIQSQLVDGVYTTPAGAYQYYASTDWFKEVFKSHTTSQIHNVSVNGHNGRVSYLLSGRMYDYDGIYVGKSDPYKKYNLRSKIDVKIADWLTIGENIEYAYDDINYGISSSGDGTKAPQALLINYGSPLTPAYNPDGTFTKNGAYILSGLVGDSFDPISYKRKGMTREITNFRTTTSFSTSFFNDTFRIKGDFTRRNRSQVQETKDTGYYYSNGVDAEGNAIMTFSLADNRVGRQSIKKGTTTQNWTNYNISAEYENTFGRNWVKGMVGWNYEKRDRLEETYKKYGLSYWDATAGNPWAFATGVLKDDYSQEKWISHGADDTVLKHWRNAGAFFRVNYSYDERYLLEINGRYDGSSVFVNEYQWGFFPSVSAAWRPTQEHWWHLDPKWISALKFRVSYGELGDCMSAGAYNTEDSFTIVDKTNRVINGNSSYRVYEIPSTSNSKYTWSTLKTTNFGVDASFFNSKLDVTYETFVRRNINMLTAGTAHTDTYGQKDQLGNNADMSTYGWELSIKYNQGFLLAGKPAHVGAHAAISNMFAIVDKFNGNETGSIKAFNYHAGQKLGDVWGYRANGLFQSQEEIDNAFGEGKPYSVHSDLVQQRNSKVFPGDIWLIDIDGSGRVDPGNQTLSEHGDLEIIGNKWARYPFNFGFDLSWGDWYLTANFQGIMHQAFFAYGGFLAINSYGYGNGVMTKWFTKNYWTTDNTDAVFPRLSQGNKLLANSTQTNWNVKYSKFPIDKFMFDSGYINLQSLQFGYNVPRKLLKKVGLSAATVYFSGENLWNWSPFYRTFGRDYDITTLTYAGDDPTEALNWFTGYGMQYPKLRTLSLGVKITY